MNAEASFKKVKLELQDRSSGTKKEGRGERRERREKKKKYGLNFSLISPPTLLNPSLI